MNNRSSVTRALVRMIGADRPVRAARRPPARSHYSVARRVAAGMLGVSLHGAASDTADDEGGHAVV